MPRLLTQGFAALWDPARGRYLDSLTTAAASQHAQAAAIVGGLAPRAHWDRLVEVLTTEADLVHATFSVPDREATPNGDFPVGGAYLRRGHPRPWWDVERQVVRAQPFFRYVVHDALGPRAGPISSRRSAATGRCCWNAARRRGRRPGSEARRRTAGRRRPRAT